MITSSIDKILTTSHKRIQQTTKLIHIRMQYQLPPMVRLAEIINKTLPE